jgi:hypothetical protein
MSLICSAVPAMRDAAMRDAALRHAALRHAAGDRGAARMDKPTDAVEQP